MAVAVACWIAATGAMALTPSNIVDEISQVSYSNLHVSLFVHTNCNRGFVVSGSQYVPGQQHDPARDFIYSTFTNLGLNTSLDPFAFSSYTNCNNVVAIKPGLDPTNSGYYIIGAHYDSVSPTSSGVTNRPGADDNASGVAGVLEIARVLSAYTFRSTLIFIAFDAEEEGLYGSSHFVADSTASTNGDPARIYRGDIRSMISLDMIAFNLSSASNQAHIYGASSIATMPVRTNLVNALIQFGGLTPFNSGGANNSDHGPFYYNGVYGDGNTGRVDSALLIEQNWPSNPNYHQVTDAVDTSNYIDYAFATRMTRAVAGYLCTQAGLVPPATLAGPVADPALGRMVLALDSMPGLVQCVEYQTNLLSDADWTILGTFTNADGAWSLSVTDEVGSVTARYYRVRSW